MGKIALIICSFLIVLNTLAGLIFSIYEPFNYVFGDISILITGGLLYLLARSSASDGFKIGLVVVLCITGIIRFFMALASRQEIENNTLLLVFIAVVGLEVMLYVVARYLKKFE